MYNFKPSPTRCRTTTSGGIEDVDGDLGRAVETCRDPAGTGAPGSVSEQVARFPRPLDEGGGDPFHWTDKVASARKADLSSVGVAAQHEIKVVQACLLMNFGGVAEEDAAIALRNVFPGGCKIVILVEVGVINADDPECLAGAFERYRLVEEDRQSGRFKVPDLFNEIMIPEDPETGFGTRFDNLSHGPHAGSIILVRGVTVVPCNDQRIVRRLPDLFRDAGPKLRIDIDVRVADLQQPEAPEDFRKARQFPMHLAGLDPEDVPVGTVPQTAGFQGEFGQAVDRDKALKPENAFSLVGGTRPVMGLTPQAFPQSCLPKALPQGVEFPRDFTGVHHSGNRLLSPGKGQVLIRPTVFGSR